MTAEPVKAQNGRMFLRFAPRKPRQSVAGCISAFVPATHSLCSSSALIMRVDKPLQ
jgi:hypothetical protein